ncbi:MAG: hypothetical protein ACK4QL_00085 [Pseudanabaenaceae cyanobacterium]
MYRAIQKGLEVVNDRYLNDSELEVIDKYVATFPVRLKTHQLLRQNADKIVNEALQEFARTESTVLAQHRATCIRDLHFVLQMVANVVINDNQPGFTDSFLWVQNIMRSVQKEVLAAKGYKLMMQAIEKHLPAECSAIVKPYLKQAIDMVSLPV